MSGPSSVRLLVSRIHNRPPVYPADSPPEGDYLLAGSLWELLDWLDFQRCAGNRFWAVTLGHGLFRAGCEPRPGSHFAPEVWERGVLRSHRPRVWRPEDFYSGPVGLADLFGLEDH